jgi:hypothetical protein
MDESILINPSDIESCFRESNCFRVRFVSGGKIGELKLDSANISLSESELRKFTSLIFSELPLKPRVTESEEKIKSNKKIVTSEYCILLSKIKILITT